MYKNFINIFYVLNQKQRVKSFVLVFLIIVGSLLEIICLFSLYEIIKFSTTLLSEEKIYKENYYISYFFLLFQIDFDIKNLIYTALFFYIIKFIYILSISIYQFKLINSIRVFLNIYLFKKYLNKDYIFYLKNNPTQLIRNIETEVGQFILGCFLQAIILITEISLLLLIIVSLFFINFEIVLTIFFVFLFISIIYFLLIKKFLLIQGKKRLLFSEKVLKSINEALYGIKNIKIFNAGNYFVNALNNNAKELAKTNTYLSVFSQVPKNALELVAVIGISLFFTSQIFSNQIGPLFFSTIGFFVIASFKILPSLSKIILSFQNLRFSQPSLNIIKKEVNPRITEQKKILLHNKKTNIFLFKDNITLKNVSFRYPGAKNNLLNKINLNIKKGDIIGVFGDSGSGKSTLIDIIIGLLKPISGTVRVDGILIDENNEKYWLEKIGYVPQKIFLTDDSVRNNVAFGKEKIEINDKKIFQSLKMSELNKFVHSRGLDAFLGQDGINISGGQIQRVGIARCLYKDSELYIFDESTNSLDESTEKKIFKVIKKITTNKTAIIISHKKDNLKICNKIFTLTNGVLKKI